MIIMELRFLIISWMCICINKNEIIFEEKALLENLEAFMAVLIKAKPSTVKGAYVKNISISSTMGPGVKIDLNSFDK